MKILLIQPNPRNCGVWPAISAPPLGLLYVASALREAGFADIRILDCRAERLGKKAAAARVAAAAPDLVGISGMSTEAEEVKALARTAKELRPGCRVVVGGPYALATPEDALGEPAVDYAVIGEGEGPAVRLARALRDGEDPSHIPGLVFRRGGATAVNPREQGPRDPDSIPFPAWDLADPELYFGLWNRHSLNPFPSSGRVMPLFTSRGCPYSCCYCHDVFGKKARLRGPESVMREIELLVGRYGAEEIEIVDDIFNLDLPRAKEICREIIRRGLRVKLSFPNGLRADRMDPELISLMKEAGTHLVYYAIESGSPAVQGRIGKNLDLDKAREAVSETARRGILVGGFFMLGFPGETWEEMVSTVEFPQGLPFFAASYFFVTPRPNTPLYSMALKERPWLAKAGLKDYFNFSVNLSAVSDNELKGLLRLANERFYTPARLWRAFRLLPSLKETAKMVLRAVLLRGNA